MSEHEAWQRDCEQAADHHIRSHLEHDRRQLARRLHEDALGMRCPGPTGQQADPIRRCLADDLLRLHHQLRPSDVPQQMHQAASAECELPQEPVAEQRTAQQRGVGLEWGTLIQGQQRVAALLAQEDDRLHQVLITLHRRLQAWVPFDDHDTSERAGVLTDHSKAERMLAAAVMDLVDALADGSISTSTADLASRIQAEVASESAAHRSHAKLRLVRLQSCIQGWLDDAPDEHEQLGDVCSELLLLCDHLGITKAAEQPGGAT
jgi:hypothetical protein